MDSLWSTPQRLPLNLAEAHFVCSTLRIPSTASAGLNKRRMVQRAVTEELVKLVDSGSKTYQMKKGARRRLISFLACVS